MKLVLKVVNINEDLNRIVDENGRKWELGPDGWAELVRPVRPHRVTEAAFDVSTLEIRSGRDVKDYVDTM